MENTSNYFDTRLGTIDDMVFLDSLRKANNKPPVMNTVRAKFTCSSLIPNPWGTSKVVHFHAVYGTEGENASYSKATPCGNLSMTIDNDTPAADYFEQGKSYYLTFEKAE